eukprot:scaffold970_cov412-Prasinococcus_capsulatus_cf.AAC.13
MPTACYSEEHGDRAAADAQCARRHHLWSKTSDSGTAPSAAREAARQLHVRTPGANCHDGRAGERARPRCRSDRRATPRARRILRPPSGVASLGRREHSGSGRCRVGNRRRRVYPRTRWGGMLGLRGARARGIDTQDATQFQRPLVLCQAGDWASLCSLSLPPACTEKNGPWYAPEEAAASAAAGHSSRRHERRHCIRFDCTPFRRLALVGVNPSPNSHAERRHSE